MTDQFHRFVGPYNLLTDSFTNIHLQMGTIYSKSSLQSVSLFQNPIFRKDNWTNSERSKARRQQQIECDSGLVSPRVKNIQVENEGHLVSNKKDQSPSWIESSAKFTRNRSIANYEENLNFKCPIKRAKSRPGASSNVTEHIEDELYHPNSIHSPAAKSKTPVRKPKSVLCSSLTNDFYSRSQDRMSPSPVRCGSKNSETSSVSEAMPVEIQNSQFGTQSQNRGISHYSAQFDQRCDFEGSRTGQNFEVTNSNFSAASGLEMSFNISAQGYLQTNACGLVKPTFPTIGPMSMASYHSLSSNPFLSHNLRMVQYHPNLQYIAATALVGEGQRQNWQQTPNAPVCHNDEDSRQMLLTNQEVISYDTAKRMYEGAINIVTGPTLTEETVDNNTRSTRSTSKITMPRKENTTKSSKKTNDSLSRNDKNMPTKKSKQKNRAAHQARPANPRRKTCKDPEEMELESKIITHVSKARSKRFSHGSEVYVVDEENKVFVIDLVNSETCDLICQLADEHCQRAEVSGNTSSSWRTLYTYSKMDLPCVSKSFVAFHVTSFEYSLKMRLAKIWKIFIRARSELSRIL